MITWWRGTWEDPELPFLTCQLAPFLTSMYRKNGCWPELRHQQQLCAELYKHVSMAVLLDVGMERNIHPLDKEPVAQRLCRLAMEDVYQIPAQAHPARVLSCARTEQGATLGFSDPVKMKEGEHPCLMLMDCVIPCVVEQPAPCTLLLLAKTDMPSDGVSYAQSSWVRPGLFSENDLPVAPFTVKL